MKKLFFGLTFLIILIVVGLYGILFTSFGNSFVASLIEKKVNEGQTQVNLKVKDFKLSTSELIFKATIDDNSIINIGGDIAILPVSFNLAYDINIKDLSKLQNVTKQKLNGSFSTKGIIKGDKDLAKIAGLSKFASSDTKYDINLVEFKPSNIFFSIKNAKIDELLYTVDKPKYASGLISIEGTIKNADVKNLDGKIVTKISNGLVNNTLVNKDFNQKLSNILKFKGEAVTNLVKTQAVSMATIETSMANLDIKKAVFDLSDNSFKSDYLVSVANLSNLYDVTQTKMRGNLALTGKIKQDKQGLYVDGVSEIFGGKLDFNLLNDNFKANIKDIEVKSLLHMMYYPEIFKSKSDVNVDYNLATKVGKVDGKLINGQFIENEYSRLINTFAKFDITKEIYESINLKSDINDKIINSIIDMESKYTKIVVPSSTIDTEKQTINALVQTKIKDYSFDTTIKGDISNPKVKVDTSGFIKNKAKDKLKNIIQKKFGDKIDTKRLFNKAPKKQTEPLNLTPNAEATNEEIAAAFKKFFAQ